MDNEHCETVPNGKMHLMLLLLQLLLLLRCILLPARGVLTDTKARTGKHVLEGAKTYAKVFSIS